MVCPANGAEGSNPLHFLVQKLCVSMDEYRRNAEYSAGRYEQVAETPAHNIPLAIVGGSVSAKKHLNELRRWTGHIWSIKGAVKWLKENGIESTVVSCHPTYKGEDWPDYASAAILDAGCPQALFERLKCPIRIFNTFGLDGVSGSVTTLGKTPHLALKLGYRTISFFGADSSMEEQSHAYENRHSPEQIIVSCNGSEYRSQPDWIWQAEYISELCRNAPKHMINRSEGLLGAMIKEPKYSLVSLSEPLWNRVK